MDMDMNDLRRYFKLLLACVFLVMFSGCVTPTIIDHPSSPINFREFGIVRVIVHDIPSTEYGSDEADIKYGKDTITLAQSVIASKLSSSGYKITTDSESDLTIDIAVTVVKPGSAAARFFVGMGAGRAVFLFDASFLRKDGKRLGRFQGGRSYTGMEFGKAFANREEISTSAAARAAEQIEEFMENGGSFPENT